jgi:formate dehydrogenase accessory protein FdhD
MGDQIRREAWLSRQVELSGEAKLRQDDWNVAAETAIEIDVNGVPLTVMMATPAELEDLAIGLAFTEGVVLDPSAIQAIAVDEFVDGIVVNLQIPAVRGCSKVVLDVACVGLIRWPPRCAGR